MAVLTSLIFNKYTWIALGVLALVAFLNYGVYRPYENMKAQAALVPALQAANKSLADQAASTDKRAAQVTVDLAIAQARRDQAVADLGKWNENRTALFADLTRMTKNAAASLNPVCMPSDGERKLWNSTLARLTAINPSPGQAGASGQVSVGAAGVH